MARYVVNGAWTQTAAAALTPPILNSPTSLLWGSANITGSPGSRPIPVRKPGVHSISPLLVTQPSWVSPDVIYPALYRSDPDIAWRHVPVRPQEMMPVPAVNLFNMPGRAMRARRTGGAYQITQPAVVQQWPDLLGRTSPKPWAGGGGAGPLPPRGQ